MEFSGTLFYSFCEQGTRMCLFCSKTWPFLNDISNRNIFFFPFLWVSSTPFGLPFHLTCQFYTGMTALVELTFWNPAEIFIFISIYNLLKTFWYGVLPKTRGIFCPLSFLTYGKMTSASEMINRQSFALPFQLLL